jgi:hypothetical protein
MELQYSYISADNANVARVIASYEDETESDVAYRFILLKYDRTAGLWGSFNLPWEVCSLTTRRVPGKEVFVLSPEGFVGRGYGGFRQEDLAGAGGDSPDSLGPLREIRAVADGVLCVGMSRQAYITRGQSAWSVMHTANMVTRKSLMEVTGFNSIHGISLDRLWAVGMGGEIWSCMRGVWRQEDSPTNLALHRVMAIDENRAYAVGQAGVVLILDQNIWQVAFKLDDVGDIWDVCSFQQDIYISTASAIYKLNRAVDDATVVPVPQIETFGYLDSADGVIWSAGTSDIAYSTDGNLWSVITP